MVPEPITLEPYKHDGSLFQYKGGGLLKSITVFSENITTVLQRRECGAQCLPLKKTPFHLTFDIKGNKNRATLNMSNGRIDFTDIPYVDYYSLTESEQEEYEKSPYNNFEVLRDVINDSKILHDYKDHPDINYYRSMISLDRLNVGHIKIHPTPKMIVAELYTNVKYSDPNNPDPLKTNSIKEMSTKQFQKATASLHPELHKWNMPNFDLCVRIHYENLREKYTPGIVKYGNKLYSELRCLFVKFTFNCPKEELEGAPRLFTSNFHTEIGKYDSQSGKIILRGFASIESRPGMSAFMAIPASEYRSSAYRLGVGSIIQYPNKKFQNAVSGIHVFPVVNSHIYERNYMNGHLNFVEVIE